ncbi:bifunctional 2-C-methyl-D-erythritol 4-phosphate cytidylyltransferase/2-C-methyl-D-erythritol 2,4-cyclodiphosphate synthase [Agromyces aureus]|uniref:Bifunctional enzyme IspD/IspF n=1 Tax=Agromyces aureus TaxID=453304 RepID=A0A191WDN2_9MICO|nr:bifunctional 2-C-methyl-D-erythritol 4-phosphate cytidylyltransferase/2-C-methyl-D-erythritol 2,4-cyclodiphosphate synthase [Agromyces aureus]ANJ26376.1 2-C-methyl-D-erythritol 2,4-cyclodiphosphate synthase [Agromyces aureus]
MSSSTVAVILVAAGSGTRLGHAEPKAFVPLGESTILGVALDAVLGMHETPHVVVVAPADRVAEVQVRFAEVAAAASAPFDVVPGGASRQDSVEAGLAVLPRLVDTVLVHDAARPLTPSLVFDEVAAAVRSRGHGIVPGLPVVDTIKRIEGGHVVSTVDRSVLAAVQTPQGFPREDLDDAFASADPTFEYTDDAAIAAAAGFTVDLVPGDARGFKITVPEDLRRAEQHLGVAPHVRPDGERAVAPASHPAELGTPAVAPPASRIGTGVDVHAFADDPATPLWLAGLEWPGERGLSGHSDGDAAAHAICDALLAAAGLGDVGAIFGTADPRFAAAHGEVFLAETRRLVEASGFRIVNVTVQIVGNRPKLAPRRAEAEALLSHVLGAPVSVAATTTDGLGFTGRGEGVSALATALLATP